MDEIFTRESRLFVGSKGKFIKMTPAVESARQPSCIKDDISNFKTKPLTSFPIVHPCSKNKGQPDPHRFTSH
jgi:hypothetical protein